MASSSDQDSLASSMVHTGRRRALIVAATKYPFLARQEKLILALTLQVNDSLFAESYAPNGTIAKLGDTIYRKRYAAALEDMGALPQLDVRC